MKVAYMIAGAQHAILCHFATSKYTKITKFHISAKAAELLHSHPQEFHNFLPDVS
jgi:hypothetical protein